MGTALLRRCFYRSSRDLGHLAGHDLHLFCQLLSIFVAFFVDGTELLDHAADLLPNLRFGFLHSRLQKVQNHGGDDLQMLHHLVGLHVLCHCHVCSNHRAHLVDFVLNAVHHVAGQLVHIFTHSLGQLLHGRQNCGHPLLIAPAFSHLLGALLHLLAQGLPLLFAVEPRGQVVPVHTLKLMQVPCPNLPLHLLRLLRVLLSLGWTWGRRRFSLGRPRRELHLLLGMVSDVPILPILVLKVTPSPHPHPRRLRDRVVGLHVAVARLFELLGVGGAGRVPGEGHLSILEEFGSGR
mmetsp:Transcript_97025/g.230867  ORF Transcript_97025/g.230867 Transcript_97025/m.230867 type:complete len:293 (-) Transcript_97025:647-1525(-)